MSGRVIVLGATSAIAEAAARRFAADGCSLTLVGRNAERLAVVAADLRARGAPAADVEVADLGAPTDAAAQLDAWARTEPVTAVVLAYGVLGDQAQAEADLSQARSVLQADFSSAAEWSLAAANLLEAQGQGALMVIGSVAGDRGRQSNYVYGAAKAGLGVLVQGIAHRFAARGSAARAVLVKPGFVDTPMTAHLPKGGPLWATPDAVGAVIHRAATQGGPVQYAPGFWRLVLALIRLTPAPIFHRTKL